MPYADYQRLVTTLTPKLLRAMGSDPLPADVLGRIRTFAGWAGAASFVLYERAAELEAALMTHQQAKVLATARERIQALERDNASLRARIAELGEQLEKTPSVTVPEGWHR